MKHNIIKTENYLLVVDDSEIKVGDWVMEYQPNDSVGELHFINREYVLAKDIQKKVISHLPLNNSPILAGIDLLPPLEDEVKKLAECEYGTDIDSIRGSTHYDLNTDLKRGFARGYNKAKEKYKYTEEDIFEYSNWLFNWCQYNRYRKLIDGVKPYGVGEFISDKDMFDKFLKEKSLQQPKMPVAFDCEVTQYTVGEMSKLPLGTVNQKPKTTTNSQGQTQWVGSYIYE